MFLPLFPLKTLMVLGLDESDLGRDIRATAKELGLGVQADPEPQRNRFVRSDQYSFIQRGHPGARDEGRLRGEHAARPRSPRKWTAERYHAPSDDLSQPIDLVRGRQVRRTSCAISPVRIANRADRPKWNDASFFKRFAKSGTH